MGNYLAPKFKGSVKVINLSEFECLLDKHNIHRIDRNLIHEEIDDPMALLPFLAGRQN